MIRKFALIPAVVLVATLGLAACGSSSSGSSSKFCKDLTAFLDKYKTLVPTDATDSPKFAEGLAGLKKLQNEAPKAIKKDIGTLTDAAETLRSGNLQAVTDPGFAKKVERAFTSIRSYASGTCKITLPTEGQ